MRVKLKKIPVLHLAAVFVLVITMLFTACSPGDSDAAISTDEIGAETADSSGDESAGNVDLTESEVPTASVKSGSYEAPPILLSSFHGKKATEPRQVEVDTTALSEGYIAMSAKSAKKLKVQLIKDDQTYTYDISSDGTPSIYPLQLGDGEYYYRVMENTTGTKYAKIKDDTITVKLKDEFQPFLRPSNYVKFDAKSDTTKKARELARSADTQVDVVKAVYDYVTKNVKYDSDKAETIQTQSDYLPDPDETLETGKGICFDYASLCAAMLRSQGIPTKLVFGYVAPDDLYHAWNMFYTEETGWVTVKFEVKKKVWTRLDLTFFAGGAPPDFVGDGSNYEDIYHY